MLGLGAESSMFLKSGLLDVRLLLYYGHAPRFACLHGRYDDEELR